MSLRPFLMILLLWCAGLGAAGQFAKVATTFDHLRGVYLDAGANLGFVLSIISFLGVCLGLVAGMVVARIGFRNMLAFGLLLGAGLSFWQASLPPVSWLLASRAVEGLSHLLIVVAAPTLIAQIANDRLRPAAMTLWSTFFGVSFAITAWAGLPIVEARGIGSLFTAHGVYMAVMGVSVLVAVPRLKRDGGAQPPALNLRAIIERHRRVYTSASMVAAPIGWLFYTLTFVSLLTILPDFAAPEDRATIIALMPLAGIGVALGVGVPLLRLMSAVRVVQIGFLAGIIIAGLMWLSPGSVVLAVSFAGALGLVQGGSFAVIPQLVPDLEGRALTQGAMAQMGNLGNLLGTPILIAGVSLAGHSGLILFVWIALGGGLIVHAGLAARRARQ